jgi:predicted dehydrogenase/threonine dehydrogenase-like Zn-dependent dehydrogenase
MKVREARMSLLEKARARPDQLKQVIDTARQQGFEAAYQKVMNRLQQLTPLGYSLSGYVTEVGEGITDFSIGQRVAAAGANLANHAEYNFLPRNLVVPIPNEVSLEQAAFTTVGSVAVHAYRQAGCTLGEVAVVIGLGLVGQILTRILVAAGIHVIGVDISSERNAAAVEAKAAAAGLPNDPSWRNTLNRLTVGFGADVVLITAGANDNAALDLAAMTVRDRGRIVIVGKTKLNLDYNIFFRKEVEVRFSRSYGPGRYDSSYEEQGRDYPYPYVRWTQRRNLEAFLHLLASKQIDLKPLVNVVRSFDDAVQVYDRLHDGTLPGIGILFDYNVSGPEIDPPAQEIACEPRAGQGAQAVSVGVIGAGNYASSMLLPYLARDQRISLARLVTTTGLTAANAARRFGALSHGTDRRTIMNNPEIKAVVIATRHKSHAALAAEALQAGKFVFVEKPLAISPEGLSLVEAASNQTGNQRLQVGFNRRFSSIIRDLAAFFRGVRPLQMIYRIHAGALDAQAWQRDVEEGGRFIGEAGHFLDVFAFLTRSSPVHVSGSSLKPVGCNDDDVDNISCVIAYADGSTGTLIYGTQGDPRIGKEYLEVHGGGQTAIMSNFTKLEQFRPGDRKPTLIRYNGGKGQAEQMKAFADSVASGGPLPVSYAEILQTTRLTLLAAEAARFGRCIDFNPPSISPSPSV